MIVVGAVGVISHSKRSKMSSGRNKGCEYNKNTKSSGDMTKRRKFIFRALFAKNSFCRFSLSLSLSLSSSSSSSSRSFYYGL